MPNYCSYDMKVKAKNKENLLEFIKIIQSDYDYDNNKFTAARHLWRVFEADCEEDEIEESEDCFSIIIYGNCAWSVNCWIYQRIFIQSLSNQRKGKQQFRLLNKSIGQDIIE